MRGRPCKVSTAIKNRIAREYANGVRVTVLASRWSLSAPTIYTYIREAGITVSR